MKINSVKIEDFKGIKDLEIDLSTNINVFFGLNGSGKSSLLEAMTISLSWLVNRIQRDSGKGKVISYSDINNKSSHSNISIIVENESNEYFWKLCKTALGVKALEKSNLSALSSLADSLREDLKNNSSLPVIAYYPVNRVVGAISPDVSSRDNIDSLDVYENALGGKVNYKSFFEWFRLQDDIINEDAQSRKKWLQNNKKWTKSRTDRLIDIARNISSDSLLGLEALDDIIGSIDIDKFIYENPQILFHQLTRLFQNAYSFDVNQHDLKIILWNIEMLLLKMTSFSDLGKDKSEDYNNSLSILINTVCSDIFKYVEDKDDLGRSSNILSYLWEAFLFAVLLSLWWMSDKGKRDIETLFHHYRRTSFSPAGKDFSEVSEFTNDINVIIAKDSLRLNQAKKNEGRELINVKYAIERFDPSYSNFRVKRSPSPHMLIDKNGDSFNLDQLSDGEKNVIALIGDIARRLSIANPYSEDALKGNGIILIDEVDLHLHPSWQQLIIKQLSNLFPNCQFIITTHSPQVLSQVKSESVFLLENIDNEISVMGDVKTYGKNTDRILEDILGVDSRPSEIKELFRELFSLIERDLDAAEKLLIVIKGKLNDSDPDILKAEMLLKRRRLLGK